jgi:hypothetical protein
MPTGKEVAIERHSRLVMMAGRNGPVPRRRAHTAPPVGNVGGRSGEGGAAGGPKDMQPREIRQAVRSWIPAVTHGDRSPLLVYDRCESTMLRCLLCLIAIPSLLAAQESPKVREAPGPTTSARIRVSCRVQQAYVGPAQQWFNSGVDSLSDEQITDLERVLSTDAEDICARGYLIRPRFAPYGTRVMDD